MGDILARRLVLRQPVADPVDEAVLNVFVAGASISERFERLYAEAGLRQGMYNVLRILRGQPAGHPRHEIARRLFFRAADVTRLIDRLERRGLVRRVRGTRDRRLSVSRITPKGLQVLARLDPPMAALREELRQKLSTREFRELSRLCEALYADDVG